MPISFSPTLGEHVEFDATNQTVSVVEPADLQFEIQNVTYHHELDMTFSDMVISVSSKSFRYSTHYEFAVRRKTYYSLQPDEFTLTTHSVETIQDLPDDYQAVYQVNNPPSYTTVTFTINGRERTVSTTTDPTTGQTQTSYGAWYAKTYTWTDRVSTNFTRHCQMIAEVVKAGKGYQASPTKPVLYS